MPFLIDNATTAISASNLLKQGRIVYFSPILDFGTLLKTEWCDFGYFPADATVAPTNNVNRTDVTAANREGGPDVVLARDVTSLTIAYDFPCLTPDATVRRLHAGATPAPLPAPLVGVTASIINPAVALDGRLIIVRKTQPVGGTQLHKVVFHPRVSLTPNGTGNSNGKDTLIFQANVQAYPWVPGADISATSLGQYGAEFTVPNADLIGLLDALNDEAAAV